MKLILQFTKEETETLVNILNTKSMPRISFNLRDYDFEISIFGKPESINLSIGDLEFTIEKDDVMQDLIKNHQIVFDDGWDDQNNERKSP